MKRARTCAVVLAAVALMFGSQAASAVSTQWFPSAGTKIDYQLSWNLSFTNGTRYTDVLFNVYNQTSEKVLYLYPKALDENVYSASGLLNYNLIASAVEITVRNEYSSTSETTLGRHVSVRFGNLTFEAYKMRVQIYRSISYTTLCNLNYTDDSIFKSGFFTAPNRFVDYIDCSKNPGDKFVDCIQPGFTTSVISLQAWMVGRSPDQLIASSEFDTGSVIYHAGYIANPYGQVTSYTYSFSGESLIPTLAGASCAFSRLDSSMLIPEYGYWAICGVLGVLVIVMGVVAAKRGRK
jgi:hypothetical protein